MMNKSFRFFLAFLATFLLLPATVWAQSLSLFRTYDYSQQSANIAANATAGSYLLTHQKDVQGGVASINQDSTSAHQLYMNNEGSYSFFRDFLDYDDLNPVQDQKVVIRFVLAGGGATSVMLRWNRTTKTGYEIHTNGSGFDNYKTLAQSNPTANNYSNLANGAGGAAVVVGHIYQLVAQAIGNSTTTISGATFDLTAPANGQPADPINVTDTGAVSTFTATDSSSPYTSGLIAPVTHYASGSVFRSVRIYENAFTASPGSFITGQVGQTITLAGTGWTAGTPGSPTFTTSFAASSGGTAPSVTAQSVSSATAATLTITTGTATGTLTITDPVSGLSTTVAIAAPPALVPSFILPGTNTPTSISLTGQVPTGGTPPYTYQWYRDAAPITAAPGSIPGGDLLTGKTSLSLTDSTPLAGMNYYALVASDSGGQAVKSSAAERVWAAPLNIEAIGDSLRVRIPSNGSINVATQEATFLSQMVGNNRTVNLINYCASGTSTGDWLPTNTATETTAGNINTNLFNTALSAAQAAGITTFDVSLTTNDSKSGASFAVVLSDFQQIIAGLKAGGATKIILHEPPAFQPGQYAVQFNEAALANLLQYRASLFPQLVDNQTVFLGDTTLFNLTAQDQTLQDDGVHFSVKGLIPAARAYADAVGKVLGLIPSTSAPYSGYQIKRSR